MAIYNGFSTKNACKPRSTNLSDGVDGGPGTTTQGVLTGKKFKLTDSQLVLQDFINALNIPVGSKVGQPGYGTTIWSYIFEPNTSDLQFQIENEIRRVASQDSRIILNYVKSYPYDNGILIEVELAFSPFNQATVISINFDQATQRAIAQ